MTILTRFRGHVPRHRTPLLIQPVRATFKSLLIALVYLLVSGATANAGTFTMTFDDLPDPVAGQFWGWHGGDVPSTYFGLQWQGFLYENVPANSQQYGGSAGGLLSGLMSGSNVAFDGAPGPELSSTSLFDLNSAYVTAAWRDNMQMEVLGFAGGLLRYDLTYTLQSTRATFIQFDLLGVDSVRFNTYGGTVHPYPYGGNNYFAVFDNVTVAVIPEPSCIFLAASGLCALLLVQRRSL